MCGCGRALIPYSLIVLGVSGVSESQESRESSNIGEKPNKCNQCDFACTALWAKLLRKWEIGKFNKITSWPLIFWKTLLFQMNLEENVTFTFYFFSFASNFPCKILWDNKNIDANIFIFSNSIFTMKGVRSKKVILRFFLKHKKI